MPVRGLRITVPVHGDLDAFLLDRFLPVGPGEDEAEVVEVLAIALGVKQVDNGAAVDAHGRKRHIPLAPGLDPLALETEHAGVVRQRPLHVADVEHQVIEADDTHGAILANEGP